MVAAITTYMVIFIQFMPKEDPNKPANVTNATQVPTVAENATMTSTIILSDIVSDVISVLNQTN